MYIVLRRILLFGLLGGAGFVGWSAWQRRNEAVGVVGTPVWPPFVPAATPAPTSAAAAEPAAFASIPDHAAQGDAVSGDQVIDADDGSADASHAHPARWVAPVDGECPPGYPIKANDNSGIFHVPGGRFYARTVPERCYADAADAEADGYRRAKA
jgi:hypothetical protein